MSCALNCTLHTVNCTTPKYDLAHLSTASTTVCYVYTQCHMEEYVVSDVKEWQLMSSGVHIYMSTYIYTQCHMGWYASLM